MVAVDVEAVADLAAAEACAAEDHGLVAQGLESGVGVRHSAKRHGMAGRTRRKCRVIRRFGGKSQVLARNGRATWWWPWPEIGGGRP
ncbi:hypothetical protein GCM10010361_53360 [Streptomyces olivaceiscleroticus]|uniref:Uncharacterized protein n=1 Tax=Streptomyces olivaceiscleroticus TaxID=68245 RepID=A0ABP3KKT2_9ACTN